MPDTLAEPAGIPGGRIMVVYFNHRAALIEVILRFGFTNDILRDPDFAEYEGVELRDARPDPAEGCLMPPDGATIIIGIPETELLPYEVLAVGWQADGFRHAGFGYREFIVPARIVNRYDRALYCLDQLHERLRARPGQVQLRQVPEAPEAPLPAAAGGAEHPAATMPLDGDQVAPEPNEPPTYPVVPVAEAVAWLAAHDPNWISQAMIGLLQDGWLEAIRRPNGEIACRRARQKETGEKYTEARAAVAAEHSERTRAGYEAGRWYTGDSEGHPDHVGYYYPFAREVAMYRGTTMTPEQAMWILRDLRQFTAEEVDATAGSLQDDALSDKSLWQPAWTALVDNADQLPPELATSAILARYAAVLADTHSNVLWSDSEVWHSGGSYRLLLGVVGRGVGYPDGGSEVYGLPSRFNGQAELRLIWYIMDCAFWADDLPVVHQCIDIIASWMHKLADWTVNE
jgi:hypothetical protein